MIAHMYFNVQLGKKCVSGLQYFKRFAGLFR